MSCILPREVVAAFRMQSDIAVDIYGIPCTLYIKTNNDTTRLISPYDSPSDDTYEEFTDVKVWVEYSPSIPRLRKLGLFNEDNIPILGWFKFERRLTVGSYIKVPLYYYQDKNNKFVEDTDELDVTDVLMQHFHDTEVVMCYKLAPRRVNNRKEYPS